MIREERKLLINIILDYIFVMKIIMIRVNSIPRDLALFVYKNVSQQKRASRINVKYIKNMEGKGKTGKLLL